MNKWIYFSINKDADPQKTNVSLLFKIWSYGKYDTLAAQKCDIIPNRILQQ